MSTKFPPLLAPYLALPPEASLTLLTGVLGASTNWLLLRFLFAALSTPAEVERTRGEEKREEEEVTDDVRVVFVSFLRDYSFWRDGARRLGLDLDKLAMRRKFLFVDGLSELFMPLSGSGSGSGQQVKGARSGQGRVLRGCEMESVGREIGEAIDSLRGDEEGKVVLVIDGMDLWLAAGDERVSAVRLEAMLLGLQEDIHSTIITLSSDLPLVSEPQKSLECDHSSFLLSMAHKADLTICLRLLDTGTARDVSGVLRITTGDQIPGENEKTKGLEERELLYFVSGDGGVKIFERGQ